MRALWQRGALVIFERSENLSVGLHCVTPAPFAVAPASATLSRDALASRSRASVAQERKCAEASVFERVMSGDARFCTLTGGLQPEVNERK